MLNKVQLIGNLGRDPEMKYTPSGIAVTNFSVATTERWAKDGQKNEKTEWHKIIAFGRLAEICGEYLVKGKQVYVEGKLQTRSWDQDGVKKYMTEIVINQMQMLGGKGGAPRGPEVTSPGVTTGNDGPVPF